MSKSRGIQLLNEGRRFTYGMIFGVWGIVAAYTVLHDQYIVQIAPEHFTVYHKALWGIKNARLLAALHAFHASISPGLLFGVACVFVGRFGSLPKISCKFVFTGTLIIVISSEILSALIGFWVYRTGHSIYPIVWYPDSSMPMLVTQTIQITSYLLDAAFAFLLLIVMFLQRRRISKSMGE